MGVCKVSLCLVLLAATTAAVSAQSPEDLCEISGGTWSDCASACPLTCDNFSNPPFFCAQVCVVGCTCPGGTVLNSAGECVATSECSDPVVPGEQQICESSGGTWSFCASACPVTCDNFNNPPFFCSLVCVTGCTCPSGTVLNSDGECVATTDCPAPIPSPSPPVISDEQQACQSSGGEWGSCASACPLTCDNFDNPPLFCIQLCVVGCTCPSGTVLNSDGECVATTDCPASVPSPSPTVPEEQQICESSGGIWSFCASACPLTCDNFNNPPFFCAQVCVVGCTCPSGTVLNSDGECVATTDCPTPISSPSPPVISGEQQVCEFSGGVWSDCASICPLTCDNFENPPFFCPQVCVVGCTCPAGTVLDPIYGCKAESFCGPTFCCEALTSECLACSAGVPEDLFCNVNPGTLGCDPSPVDGCASIECPPGSVCKELVIPSLPPYSMTTGCVSVVPPIESCDLVVCEPGSSCDDGNCVCDDILPGDADNDGSVQVNDIVLVIEAVLGPVVFPECIFDAVDLTEDGALSVADVVVLVEIIVG